MPKVSLFLSGQEVRADGEGYLWERKSYRELML